MSEVSVHQPGTELAELNPAAGNGTDLAAWVADLGNAFALADKICRTPFAPKDFQGKPESAAIAILHGKSLGLDPLASMSSIFVVSGRPGLYSKAMHAIVLAAGHQVWVESESAVEVVVKGKRRGSDTVSTSRWTPERAQQAGYFSNAKYETEPIAMLRARAIGDVCRVVAPDVLAGLAYNEADVAVMEDLGESVIDGDTLQPLAEKKPRRTIQRAQAPTPVVPAIVHEAPRDQPEPEVEPDVEPVAEALPTGEPCTMSQQKKLAIILDQEGYTDRAQKLELLTNWTGRTITSSKDLAKDEASRLIDEIENGSKAPATDQEIDAAWGITDTPDAGA